jgi:hypothetical protein
MFVMALVLFVYGWLLRLCAALSKVKLRLDRPRAVSVRPCVYNWLPTPQTQLVFQGRAPRGPSQQFKSQGQIVIPLGRGIGL